MHGNAVNETHRFNVDDFYEMNTFYSIWREDTNFILSNNNNPNALKTIRNLREGSNEKNIHRDVKLQTDKNHTLQNLPSVDNSFSDPKEVVEQFRLNPHKTYYWQRYSMVWTFIGEVPALQYDDYAFIAP